MRVELFPLTEVMSSNWRCLVQQISGLSFAELQDMLNLLHLYCIGSTTSVLKTVTFVVNCHYFSWLTEGFGSNKWLRIERAGAFKWSDGNLIKLNNFYCSMPLADSGTLKNKLRQYSTCIRSFSTFAFKSNSQKGDKSRFKKERFLRFSVK